MAKVKHNNLIDTLNTIAEDAKARGVIQLHTEDEQFSGRVIRVKGKDLFHFGTTGYLGLEQDIRLKNAAVDAIMKFGTQFPLSKSYISHSLYQQLEEKLEQMYELNVLVMKNSTLGHMGVIPSIVRDEDAVLLDHHVHWSVQNAALLLKNRGIEVDMIRHNDMEMLESQLRKLSSRHKKIWYCADGVYSMFGDTAPIAQLKELCRKYSQLYLYFDDVHGMSWCGKNGTGYVLSQYGELPENVFLFSTLSKSFGASGGIFISSNAPLFNSVKNFGGPLTFSAQLEPASVAAAIASADIHLSPEIYELQKELKNKVQYCNDLLEQTNLPLVDKNDCPVFYIGTGAPAVGYNFVNKLYDAGFYANMGIFPAVPVKKTGVRFTVSRHNTLEDIKSLIDTMQAEYPRSLKEESYSMNGVRRIFGLPLVSEPRADEAGNRAALRLELFESASGISPDVWNSCFSGEGVFDHAGLLFLEEAFSGNEDPENNWQFYYLLVRDQVGKIVAATFFTYALWKEDMLAPASVSAEFEKKRETEPGFMVSHALVMGSLFTEGSHLYLNRSHPAWKEALNLLVDKAEHLDQQLNASCIVLRDFDEDDADIEQYILKKGYFKTALPESCNITDLSWADESEYLTRLSARSRKHFRQEIEPFIDHFDVEVKDKIDRNEITHFYQLYRNVWEKNLDMNMFPFKCRQLQKMSEDDRWEFIVLRLTEGYRKSEKDSLPVAVMFCYKNKGITYVPAFIGMDYDYVQEHQVYRQMLYQTILRAKALGCQKINFGYSSSFEKRKVGAVISPKVAYLQVKDNYSLEKIGIIQKS